MAQIDYLRLAALIPGGAPKVQEPEKDFSLPLEVGRAIGTGVRDLAQSVIEIPEIFGKEIDYEVPEFVQRPETTAGKFGAVATQIIVPYSAAMKAMTWIGRGVGAAKGIKASRAAAKTTAGARAASGKTRADRAAIAAGATARASRAATVSVGKAPTRAQRIFKYAGAGAAADFVAFSANDPNLSNAIADLTEDKRIPAITAISEFLATDVDDPAALNRFRNVLEGLALGALIPVALKAFGKGFTLVGQGAKSVTPAPVIDFTAKRLQGLKTTVDKGIFKIADAAHPFKIVSDVADKLGFDQTHKKFLNAWQTRRSLADLAPAQQRAYTNGWHLPSKTTGEFTRIGDHKALNDIAAEAKKDLTTDEANLFNRWLYAEQGKQHNYTDKKSNISDIEIREVGVAFDQLSSTTRIKFASLQKDIQNYNKAALDYAEHHGLIDAATRDAYEFVTNPTTGKKEVRTYSPTYRQGDDVADEIIKADISKKKTKGKDKIRRGRMDASEMDDAQKIELAVDHPLNNVFTNLKIGYDSLVESAYHNKIKRSLYDTIIQINSSGGPRFAKKVNIYKKSKKSDKSKKDDASQIEIDNNRSNTNDRFRSKTSNTEVGASTDTFWRDGKKETWEIEDQLLLDGIRAMGPQNYGDFAKYSMRWGGKVKNFLTRMITSSPTFFIGRNFARDTLSVFMLKRGFIPFISSYRGLFHQIGAIPGSNLREQIRIAGGEVGGGRAYGDFGNAADFMSAKQKQIHHVTQHY